jgi:hypothetical protein
MFANLGLKVSCLTLLKRQIWTTKVNINISRVFADVPGLSNNQDRIRNKWELEFSCGISSKKYSTILEMFSLYQECCWKQAYTHKSCFTDMILLLGVLGKKSIAKEFTLCSNHTEDLSCNI